MKTQRQYVEWPDSIIPVWELRSSLATERPEVKYQALGTLFEVIEGARSNPTDSAQLVKLRASVRGARRRLRDGLERRGQRHTVPSSWRVDGSTTRRFELTGPRAALDAARARGALLRLSVPPARPAAAIPAKPTRSRRQQRLDTLCLHFYGRPWWGK
jgi:hypothetical protein